MVFTTRVGLAKAGTRSMKTTIPEGIVEFLEIGEKDELDWKMQILKNERFVIVSKKADSAKQPISEIVEKYLKEKEKDNARR
jgi:hypothetical protein